MLNATLLFLSGPDLLVVAILAIFLFGGKYIPGLAKGLGETVRNFKDGDDKKDEVNKK